MTVPETLLIATSVCCRTARKVQHMGTLQKQPGSTALTCCTSIIVPSVATLEVQEAQRCQGQLEKTQVHEEQRRSHSKLLPLWESPACQVGQDGAEEQHLHHIE